MRRVILPLGLTGLGLWLLVGCIYVPWRDKVPPGERDPRPFVGKLKSDRPLRVSESTQENVRQILGEPTHVG